MRVRQTCIFVFALFGIPGSKCHGVVSFMWPVQPVSRSRGRLSVASNHGERKPSTSPIVQLQQFGSVLFREPVSLGGPHWESQGEEGWGGRTDRMRSEAAPRSTNLVGAAFLPGGDAGRVGCWLLDGARKTSMSLLPLRRTPSASLPCLPAAQRST